MPATLEDKRKVVEIAESWDKSSDSTSSENTISKLENRKKFVRRVCHAASAVSNLTRKVDEDLSFLSGEKIEEILERVVDDLDYLEKILPSVEDEHKSIKKSLIHFQFKLENLLLVLTKAKIEGFSIRQKNYCDSIIPLERRLKATETLSKVGMKGKLPE